MRALLSVSLAYAAAAIALAAPAAADHSNANLPWPEHLPPQEVSTKAQPQPLRNCRRARLACVKRVVARMTRRWQQLDAGCDHRSVFALTYLRTTEAFLQTITQQRRFFRHRRWVIYEDVLFAGFYFRAFDRYARGKRVPDAWRIAFEAAAGGATNAGHDVFLGMNAHIQRDLPYVLAKVGLRTPAGRSRKPDHDRVNRILTTVIDPAEDELARRYDPMFPLADAKPSPVEELAALELLKSWREGAWRNAERLLNADSPEERREVSQSIETQSRTWAEAIRAGQTPGYGAAVRDPHCRAGHGGTVAGSG
jgi:Family of unknown function (DUF5995)